MDTPEIPADRPSSWIVDEDGNWTETDFLVVGGSPDKSYDTFGTTSGIDILDGQRTGGVWRGCGEPDDFTVEP